MEYLVMECGLSYAVVLDQDGRILKVPNLGYTVGQSLKDVVLLPERPVRQQVLHKRIARWSALAACLCLLLLGSWVWQSPIGTVRMQINPDVLLSVNRFDRVVALEGLNEDGTALIDGYRAYGQEMKTVSDELADRAMELGYLSAGGQITLTVDSEKGDWKTAAEELLLNARLKRHYAPMDLADTGTDMQAAYYDEVHMPTVILQKGNRVIKATLYQTGEYTISMDEWAGKLLG